MLQAIVCNLRNLRPIITASKRLYSEAAGANFTTSAVKRQPAINVTKVLQGWDEKLKAAGVGDIDFNLKCLVAHVLKQRFSALPNYEQLQFTAEQLVEFERLCEARCARMPLQYILGEWEFMGLTLKMAPTVFIPRPETEEFVQKVIKEYRDAPNPLEMLEVGCGSGAMSLAILHHLPHIKGTAIERSKAATKLAWENAKLLGLEDRFSVFNHTMEANKLMPEQFAAARYDLIISNPPYVKSDEFQHLQPEVVVYENLNALDGGPDGLRVARLVLDLACIHLHSGGKLWLELGSEHPPLIQTLVNLQYENKLSFISSFEDQYKRERFVELQKV